MVTGQDIVDKANKLYKRIKAAGLQPDQEYVYGVQVPKNDADYLAPFDCAEWTSFVYYQVTGLLFGTDQHHDPHTADSYTGYWLADAKHLGTIITVEKAKTTPGAFLLRYGVPGRGAHIVISDGKRRTIEAHSHTDGMAKLTADGRGFNYGILPPGVNYGGGKNA